MQSDARNESRLMAHTGRFVGRVLAEARAHLWQRMTVIGLTAAAVSCAVAGPFGTGQILTAGPRLMFWTVMVVATYSAGMLASEVAWQSAGQRVSPLRALVLGAIAPALVVPPVVLAVNLVMLGTPYPFDGLAAFVVSLSLVGGAVGTLAHLGLRQASAIPHALPRLSVHVAPLAALGLLTPSSAPGLFVEPVSGSHSAEALPKLPGRLLLDRLQPEDRAPLVALSGKNHYVLVRTLKGETRLLMRLSDAIGEVGDTPGLQVHRSHWVAQDRVDGVRHDGTRLSLRMATGPDIPVSRASIPALRAAGLLPR